MMMCTHETTNDGNWWQNKFPMSATYHCCLWRTSQFCWTTTNTEADSQHLIIFYASIDVFTIISHIYVLWLHLVSSFRGNCVRSNRRRCRSCWLLLLLLYFVLWHYLSHLGIYQMKMEIKYVTVMQRDHDFKWNETKTQNKHESSRSVSFVFVCVWISHCHGTSRNIIQSLHVVAQHPYSIHSQREIYVYYHPNTNYKINTSDRYCAAEKIQKINRRKK